MGKLDVTDFYLYQWRYIIGGVGLISALIAVLAIAGFWIPGGLAKIEMDAATTSIHTPPSVLQGSEPEHLPMLPYHGLQKLSITIFGVSNLAIKLPSLILAGLSIVMLYGVVRLWFRRNVAIITSAIAVTSAQFLLLAQLGTPAISYIFWTVAILFSTSILAHSQKYRSFWLIITSVLAALSLYSPLGIYLIIALAVTSLIHPHARFIILNHSKIVLAICLALFSLLAAPLVLGIVAKPELLIELAGVPSLSALSLEGAWHAIEPYVAFYAPKAGIDLQPVYGLATALLMTLGAVRLFTAKYTAKSYIISLVSFFVFAGIFLQTLPPAYTFIPAMLLVAFAVNYLITSWYDLFPINPYARVVGLLPLAVLMFGVSFTELERYAYTYHYNSASAATFSRELRLLDRMVKQNKSARITLLVHSDDKRFYTDYASRLPDTIKLSVTDNPESARKKAAHEVIIATEGFKSATIPTSSIAVSSAADDAAKLYLYKNGY